MTSTATQPTDDALFLPDDASLPTRLRIAWNALKILRYDARNPVAGNAVNLCLDRGVYARVVDSFARTDEGRRILAERPSLDSSALDLRVLERLPHGTLGRELVQYFHDNGISPFDSPYALRNDVEYISKRYRETHDLAHVLTGYATDIVGEMEVQAFMLGNLGIPTAGLILTFAMVNVIPQLEGITIASYLRRLRGAYRRGSTAAMLLSVRYERFWDAPLDAVRTQLAMPAAA